MEKFCEEKHKTIDQELDRQERRLNNHSAEIDKLKLDMIAIQKDSSQLKDAIEALKKSVDILIDEIGKLKIKPLDRYEKIILVIITFIISWVLNRSLGV